MIIVKLLMAKRCSVTRMNMVIRNQKTTVKIVIQKKQQQHLHILHHEVNQWTLVDVHVQTVSLNTTAPATVNTLTSPTCTRISTLTLTPLSHGCNLLLHVANTVTGTLTTELLQLINNYSNSF